MIVTSFGCNKNRDDEIKNIAGRIPEATRKVQTSKKTVIAAEAITFCIKLSTHCLTRSDLKIGENQTTHQEKQNAAKFYIIENLW